MARRGVLKGKKISKQHSTYNQVTEQVLLLLKDHEEVRKIALGPIKHLAGGERRVTVREDQGQARIQCRDIGSVQIIWVIGMDPDSIRNILESNLSYAVK